jgi:glycosyltransferase involved in cell wall biosynthesis
MTRIPLLYMLHSGNLYGTERMALATAEGLADKFDCVILSPQGPVQAEAARIGLRALSFSSTLELARLARPTFAASREVAVIATGVAHSLAAISLNAAYRRRMAHLHVVHGGTDERLSYGRKSLLNRSSALLVAVSTFVKERLIANGSREKKIHVIENFLPDSRVDNFVRRKPFSSSGIRKVVVNSRIDPIKRVDLLLSAMDHEPRLRDMQVRILGTGWEFESLRAHAAQSHPNITFAGFTNEVEKELAGADLLLHMCPAEPFGLAILEAMAAHVPVVVPDSGGAGSLVEDGVSGFRFRADDVVSLSEKLLQIGRIPAPTLNRVVENARHLLSTRFAAVPRINDYNALLERGLA